jgi:hypothetical protein
MSFRDFLDTTVRGVPRAIAALLAQRGTSRVDGLLSSAGLAASATNAKFKTTLKGFYAIAGVVATKVPTDNLVFSAAHTVTKTKHGAVLVQINAAGAVSTKVTASPQAFDSAIDARKALPVPDASNVGLGFFAIAADKETDGLRTAAGLAISATATDFKTTAIAAYRISSVNYTKAITDLLVFTAAHVVTAAKFGVILVQIDATGAITTKVPLATQAYADTPTALAALPAVDAGNAALGYITIAAGVTDWTGNATALTTVGGFVDGANAVEHDWVAATDALTTVTQSFHNATDEE